MFLKFVSGLEERPMGDCLVIRDRAKGYVHVLNETATFIRKQLDGEHNIEDIAAILVNQFHVNYEQALRDVNTILEQFQNANLIENSPSV
jgi:hypothetical protein